MKRSLAYGTLLTGLSLLAGLMLVLSSGCAAVQSALNIENPRYSIRDVRPRVAVAIPLSASSIDVDFALEVDNPNRVGLDLDEINFNLFINESRILESVRSQQGVRIPANGRGDIQLRTRIGYDNLRSLWSEMVHVIQGNRARYELRGDAFYDTPVGRLRFPVAVSTTR
ncbi:MAG TPA: LEA type 2 family protein [Thermoanaerobaculia bacterium]|jgi:LEA14-like dessication related protein